MMRKAWIIAIVALVVVFGGLFGAKWLMNRRAAAAAANMGPPPMAVATTIAKVAAWDPDVGVVGSLAAVDGTHITAQIAGNITRVAFRPGAHVGRGALLVQLDDSTQRAQLHADEARLALAKTELARARALRSANAASEAALQSAEAELGTSAAAVENDRAILAKLRITAPFAGIVGVREVSVGQYVSPGTPIVRLQNLDPLLLNFALPQQLLARLNRGAEVRFTVDSYPGEVFRGRISALDSAVDPDTRNIAIQAVLRNPDGRLRPGLYGSVSLNLGAKQEGVELPETAIAYSTFGNIVYVVTGKDQKTARARNVSVTANRNGRVLIGSGLKAGEEVVVAGQNKLQDGAPITINNAAPTRAGAAQ